MLFVANLSRSTSGCRCLPIQSCSTQIEIEYLNSWRIHSASHSQQRRKLTVKYSSNEISINIIKIHFTFNACFFFFASFFHIFMIYLKCESIKNYLCAVGYGCEVRWQNGIRNHFLMFFVFLTLLFTVRPSKYMRLSTSLRLMQLRDSLSPLEW